MKKIIYFAFLMTTVVVILPLLIVKGCGPGIKEEVPIQKEGIALKVYFHSEDKIREMPLEEYVKGVVAAEMPAEFGLEALKAQAVAARTYAYSRYKKVYSAEGDVHKDADICTNPAHCQAWVSKESAKKRWGILASIKYWNKIEKSVADTQNIVITYNNSIINPLFHSNSGGRTENAEEVWAGVEVPYLKSVLSDGEDVTSEFKSEVSIKIEDFCKKLKEKYPDIKMNEKDIIKDINILDYTTGERVKAVKIGNTSIKGTDFRTLFSLRSAKFKVEKNDEDTLKITTWGNGHGVGMSQWGANHFAGIGKKYDEILKYYYKDVELSTIDGD